MTLNLRYCQVCMQSNNNVENNALDLYPQGEDAQNIIKKLRYLLNIEFEIYENNFMICNTCTDMLNKACTFKENTLKAFEYWSKQLKNNLILSDGSNLKTNTRYSEVKTEAVVLNKDNKNTIKNNIEIENNTKVILTENNVTENSTKYPDLSYLSDDYDYDTSLEITRHESAEQPIKASKKLNNKTNDFKCDLCQVTLNKRWKLNKHMKTHVTDKKYVCTFCDRAFKQSYHLQEHITSHTLEKNFSCRVCGKTFQRVSSQKRHMRTHEAPLGEKSKKTPFLCNICGKSFPYSNGAQRHMRIHTGDRRHECGVCRRKFSQSTHLRVHLRVHTGEKPYNCNVCGEAFSIKASLRKHVNGHNAKNNVKIMQNLEPNLSSRVEANSREAPKKGFEIDDIRYHLDCLSDKCVDKYSNL